MITKSLLFSLLVSAMLAIPMLGGGVTINSAKAYDRCAECDDLWYERNAIYADKGYCFKTRRARAVFGRRCYPPYGRLNRWERRRVNAITRAERALRCKRRCR